MNDRFFTLRGLATAALALLILVLLAGPGVAAVTSIDQSQPSACFAHYFQDIAGNRSKIIQLSIVFVLVGIALLFKK